MIAEEAKFTKARNTIWEKALELENELKSLNEGHRGFMSSFGFEAPGDSSNVTKTGFVSNEGPISSLSSLGAEIQAAHEAAVEAEAKNEALNEDLMNVVAEMKQRIEALEKENKDLKK